MNNLKENLISYRKQYNMTQKQLAIKLNVSTNNIGHWEKGRTEPNIDTLIKLAEIFNVSIEELIKY
jgi:transcriptional regulator with XRE-family HTH domain